MLQPERMEDVSPTLPHEFAKERKDDPGQKQRGARTGNLKRKGPETGSQQGAESGCDQAPEFTPERKPDAVFSARKHIKKNAEADGHKRAHRVHRVDTGIQKSWVSRGHVVQD